MATFLEGVSVGDRLTGTISGIKKFGIFVNLGQAEGLVHLEPHATMFLARKSQFRLLKQDGTADWLSATVGVEQGDPWGPWYYAMGIAPALGNFREKLAERAAQLRAERRQLQDHRDAHVRIGRYKGLCNPGLRPDCRGLQS